MDASGTLTSRGRDAVTVAAFRAGWSLVRRLPPRTAYRLFDAMASATYRRNGGSVQRLRANYAVVRPDLTGSALEGRVKAGVAAYLRYWCEAFRLPDLRPEDLSTMIRVEGDGPVREDLAAGRSVACFLGHMGNWDTAAVWAAAELAPVLTVAERLKPEELFREFLSFRERLGMTILPLTGGGDVFGQLRDAARGGRALIPLLADRDLTRGGITVSLCGAPARVAVGPAALAVSAGAVLYPFSMYSEASAAHPSGYRLVGRFHDAVAVPASGTTREKVAAMTQACVDALGDTIREHPEDWHMMQRVFVAHLDPARLTSTDHASEPAGT